MLLFQPLNIALGKLMQQKSQQLELSNQDFSQSYANCYLQSEV